MACRPSRRPSPVSTPAEAGPDPTTAEAIVFREVYKRFERLEVLKGISGKVAPREVVVICGPSGSGKSTLLRCINRLESIDAGQVYVFGQAVHDAKTDVNRLRTHIGMVFQQ